MHVSEHTLQLFLHAYFIGTFSLGGIYTHAQQCSGTSDVTNPRACSSAREASSKVLQQAAVVLAVWHRLHLSADSTHACADSLQMMPMTWMSRERLRLAMLHTDAEQSDKLLHAVVQLYSYCNKVIGR